MLSQAKNNLGQLDLPSLRYHVRTAEVPTEEGPAYVGVLEFLGETDRNVSDILTETSSDPHERTERDEAAEWLTAFLVDQGGEAASKDVLKAARNEGYTTRTLQRARSKAGVTTHREGFPATTVWRLADNSAASPALPVAPVMPQSRQPSGDGTTGPTVARLDDSLYPPSPPSGSQTSVSDDPEGTAA